MSSAAAELPWLCQRFGLSTPVVCAPMAGVAGGRLAAAVSAAGGLGMVGVGHSATPEWIAGQCATAAASGKPFGVGLMAWALGQNPGQLGAVAAASPALVSVSYGLYASVVPTLQEEGIAVATQVGNLDEALSAEQAGVDVIVARGGEGGGHGRNEVATLPLLQAVLDSVDRPVLAAGGITTARGVAAVLAAGAAGAWVGTAFSACHESETPQAAKRRLLAASETDTAYGRVFDVAQRLAWPPEYGGRALRNQFFERWVNREEELAADESAHQELASARRSADYETAYIYAGQGVGLLREERSAAQVLAELSPKWPLGSAP